MEPAGRGDRATVRAGEAWSRAGPTQNAVSGFWRNSLAPDPRNRSFDREPRQGNVSLRLQDVTGREVAALAKGPRGPGRHQVSVAAQRLAPGRYHSVPRALGVVEKRRLTVRR